MKNEDCPQCPKCLGPMTDATARRIKSGPAKGRFRSYCTSCSVVDDRERRVANPEKFYISGARRQALIGNLIKSLKSERPCYDCGGTFPPEGMDFDHVLGKKSFTIGNGARRNWHQIRREIDKCQLVCAVCHRVRTKQRNIKY